MLTRLSSVAKGIGGVGLMRGRKRESTRTTKDIVAKTRAGRRTMLATIKKTTLAPAQKTILKVTISVAGGGLPSGGGNCSRAMNSMPAKSLRMKQ